jgi:hypothetical protein
MIIMILQTIADLFPAAPWILITIILICMMIGLYAYFGLNFISKGKKSNNEIQKSYYKGLGRFIMTVAVSESMYVIDYLSRVLFNRRIFSPLSDYVPLVGATQLDSMFAYDYYVAIFMLLSCGLVFLFYPVEKYLLARKTKVLTISSALCIPVPFIARFVELSIEKWTGEPLAEDSLNYYITSAIWLVDVLIIVLSVFVLFSLYLKIGVAAPPGSILRKKSRFIVFGMVIWVTSILCTSLLLRQIWDDFNPADPLLFLYPFIIPVALGGSLAMISYGFTREYN